MKTRIGIVVVLVTLIQSVIPIGQTKTAHRNSPAVASTTISQAGTAVLSVSSGFRTSPDPLAGRALVLFKESFGAFLKRKGMFQGPPGSSIRQPPLGVWAYACQTANPVCQQALLDARPNSVSEARMDANARATLPGVPPGTYYLFLVAAHNQQFIVWDLRVDLRAGSNTVTLDQSNTASLNAQSNAREAGTQRSADTQACKGVDHAIRRSGAPATSTLSVRGSGYVYTYTNTDRRTGQVLDSFTERGNFTNTKLFLLDEDADAILQKAGIERGLLPSRLAMFTFLDAGTQVGNAPGMDLLAGLSGSAEELAAFTKEREAEFECAMRAIRAHSVAEVTTDAKAMGTFPNVPAGTYYLFGRFYRITKPVRGGGVLWNLKTSLKPGRNGLVLSVDNAVLK